MTVQTSAIPAAWNYLVTAATAAFATANPPVLICDGPLPIVDLEDFEDRVMIGWDGSETSADAVTGAQGFRNLDRGITKDETFEIVCSVTHWDGTNSVAAARTAAFSLFATFEGLMRGYPPNGSGDVTLGGAVTYAGIGGGIQVIPDLTDQAASFTIVFRVACTARLTGA
jgi:hypothetical protein